MLQIILIVIYSYEFTITVVILHIIMNIWFKFFPSD